MTITIQTLKRLRSVKSNIDNGVELEAVFVGREIPLSRLARLIENFFGSKSSGSGGGGGSFGVVKKNREVENPLGVKLPKTPTIIPPGIRQPPRPPHDGPQTNER